jgi:signal transduction histidine kinase
MTDLPASPIATYIRTHKQQLSDEWERAVVADRKELTSLDRGALLDHLPEVLNGLAAWMEGRKEEADRCFAALADGHALQRLGFGIELAVVSIEYAWLRHVILEHVLRLPAAPDSGQQLVRLNAGLDRAVQFSIRRYTERRDLVRDRFIGILGHDLRNPLNAATVATHMLLQSETLPEQDRRFVLTIARSTARMNHIVRDVLDFARGHLGGGIPAHPAGCDMGEICRSAVEEISAAHPLRKIELSTRGDLRGTFDRERVLQAIGNLLGNAIQHGRDPIQVQVWERDDREAIVTRVANRGAAIPREMIGKLFDPFVRAGDEPKQSLGLGLYIVAQIARAHGATYDIASNDEQTVVEIRWPRSPRTETPDRP